MSEFQSMACSNGGWSFGWEFENLEQFNTDMPHSLILGSSTPPYASLFDSDISTGYLQDALFEFTSKRRRLLSFPIQSCFKENWNDNLPESVGYMSQANEIVDSFNSAKTINRTEGARSSFDGSSDSLSSHQSKDSLNDNIPFISDNRKALYSQLDGISTLAGGGDHDKVKKRVVYPFAVVKPGGLKGDVTLNDINKRILKPPSRPVRHPVGDFACPQVVSPHGPGLSGKAVVALTKIQTRGSGTITIIRTRG